MVRARWLTVDSLIGVRSWKGAGMFISPERPLLGQTDGWEKGFKENGKVLTTNEHEATRMKRGGERQAVSSQDGSRSMGKRGIRKQAHR
jgi:hypothetical protein